MSETHWPAAMDEALSEIAGTITALDKARLASPKTFYGVGGDGRLVDGYAKQLRALWQRAADLVRT